MGRILPVLAVKGTAPTLLLLAVLVLTLGSCGSGGGTTSAKTGGGGTTFAGTASRTVDLTPSRDSGVRGTATLTDTQYGVEVSLDMSGLPLSSTQEHQAHIHQEGTCADDRADNPAPVEYDLNPVPARDDGTGSSTITIVGVTVDQLFSGPPKYIDVHREYTGEGLPPKTTKQLPPSISCADLSTGG